MILNFETIQMFDEHDIDEMNETDVREIIVRPFLHALGYQQGTNANIRTEVPLKYTSLQLGRKQPHKDPPMKDLRGRPDYFLDVVSYGRWAADAKAPNVPLDEESSMQCHTYCTHPELGVKYYLLVNGREFAIFEMGRSSKPILQWSTNETQDYLQAAINLLGPESIRKKSIANIDFNLPVIDGLGSNVLITGGTVSYDEVRVNIDVPQNILDLMTGFSVPIVSGGIARDRNGLLVATFTLDQSTMAGAAHLQQGTGHISYSFLSSSEQVSADPDAPTIFQSVIDETLANLDHLSESNYPDFLKANLQSLPMPYRMQSLMEAIGYLDGKEFVGTHYIKYEITILESNPLLSATDHQSRMMRQVFEQMDMEHLGKFVVTF